MIITRTIATYLLTYLPIFIYLSYLYLSQLDMSIANLLIC